MKDKFTPVFAGKIINGSLKLEDREGFSSWIKTGYKSGDKVDLVLKKRLKRRSTQANGYYWSVVLPVSAEATGHTVDELHTYFLNEFAPYRIINTGAIVGKIPIRTSQMRKEQFHEYLEAIIDRMASMGCEIPPAEKIENNY